MTKAQTAEMLAAVRLLWPHSNLGDNPRHVLTMWHDMLAGWPVGDVEAALREIAAGGRDHAPPVGVVVKTLAARVDDLPEWDETWGEIDRLIRRHGSYQPPPASAFSHPVVAAFALPAWQELCMGPAPGTNGHGTHEAQQREAFRALRGRVARDRALLAINAPRRSSLRRLDTATAVPAGRRALLAAVPEGGPAA